MNRFNTILSVLGITLFACTRVWAASVVSSSPLGAGQELSLKQAIYMALQEHPRIKEARSYFASANERVGEARSAMLPQVYGTADYLRSTDNGIGDTSYVNLYDTPRIPGRDHNLPLGAGQSLATGDNYMLGTSISQFLLDFGRVRGLIDEARFNRYASRARLDLDKMNLIYEVSQRYFEVLAAKQKVKVFETAVKQRSEQVHEANVMAQTELKPEIDVYTTQAQLARAQLHLLKAQNAYSDAKVALENALGLSDSAPDYHLSDKLQTQALGDRLPDLLREALMLRPDMKMLKAEAAAAGAQIVVYRSDYYPTTRAIGGYSAMSTGLPAVNNFYVGIAVTWPIFNGFQTEHAVADAKYRRDALTHAVEELRQKIYQQVTSSFLDSQAAFVGIRRAKRTLDASQVELRLASERYRSGLGNVVELEDAQRRFTDDSAAYVDALYQYATAGAAVMHATASNLTD